MRQKKHIHNIVYVPTLIFGFILGFFLSKYIPFHFSETISIVINPSIIITIILAFYVTRVLTQKNEKDKQEKLVLIEYFKDFQKQLHTKSDEIVNKGFDFAMFNMYLKSLRQKLHSSLELIKRQKFIIDSQNTEKLSETITNIWEILTDEDNYNEDKYIKLEFRSSLNSHIIEIDELIFRVILEINNQ